MDGSTDKIERTISLGSRSAYNINVNSITNMVYSISHDPNKIYVIDGSTDKIVVAVRFNIHPANSGGVICDNKEYPTNTYLYVAYGTKCKARPYKDFEFSSWIENEP